MPTATEPSALDRPIVALTYTDTGQAAVLLRRLRDRLLASGKSCAGFLQHDEPACDGRPACDMLLESLSSGEWIRISEYRGRFARGCRLDVSELMSALAAAREAVQARPDALIINKFGKTERDGGGFRPLIVDAIELGIPVLIAVPWRNIESWRQFAGDHATELDVNSHALKDDETLLAGLGLLASLQVPIRGSGITPGGWSNASEQ